MARPTVAHTHWGRAPREWAQKEARAPREWDRPMCGTRQATVVRESRRQRIPRARSGCGRRWSGRGARWHPRTGAASRQTRRTRPWK
eukprot:5705057-Prymnesium_polylepis.1